MEIEMPDAPQRHRLLELPELLGQILEVILMDAASTGDIRDYDDFLDLALVSKLFYYEVRRVQRYYSPTWLELLQHRPSSSNYLQWSKPIVKNLNGRGMMSFSCKNFEEAGLGAVKRLPAALAQYPVNRHVSARLEQLLAWLLNHRPAHMLFPGMEILEDDRLPSIVGLQIHDVIAARTTTLSIRDCYYQRPESFDAHQLMRRLDSNEVCLEQLVLKLIYWRQAPHYSAFLQQLMRSQNATAGIKRLQLDAIHQKSPQASFMQLSKWRSLEELKLGHGWRFSTSKELSRPTFKTLKILEIGAYDSAPWTAINLIAPQLEKVRIWLSAQSSPANDKIFNIISVLIPSIGSNNLRQIAIWRRKSKSSGDYGEGCCEPSGYLQSPAEGLPRIYEIMEYLVKSGATQVTSLKLDMPFWYWTKAPVRLGFFGVTRMGRGTVDVFPDLERRTVHILKKFPKLVTLKFAQCSCTNHSIGARPASRMLRRRDLEKLQLQDFNVTEFCRSHDIK